MPQTKKSIKDVLKKPNLVKEISAYASDNGLTFNQAMQRHFSDQL